MCCFTCDLLLLADTVAADAESAEREREGGREGRARVRLSQRSEPSVNRKKGLRERKGGETQLEGQRKSKCVCCSQRDAAAHVRLCTYTQTGDGNALL